ncbi:MAG: hypothetical protein KDC05_08155 [Bacteroidales bacterium]|nr:hypothetical protein [Bacteroidales bacterium]
MQHIRFIWKGRTRFTGHYPGRLICLLVLLHCAVTVSGNDTTLIRLNNELSAATTDSSRVDLLLKMAKLTLWSDTRLSDSSAREALELSEEIGYVKGKAVSNFYLSQIFVDIDFKFAEELIMKALQNAEKINNRALIAKIRNNIGHLKNNMGEFKTALTYFESSLQYFLETDNDSASAAIYNNMAISYKSLSEDSLAMTYYFRAAAINASMDNYLWLTSNYFNIGYDYLDMGDTVNGIQYLNQSFDLAREHGFDRMLPYIFGTYGNFYLQNNNFKQARMYALKALQASREQMNRLQEKNALSVLKDVFYHSGKFDSAFVMLEKIVSLNDSINMDKRQKQLDLMDIRIRFEKELSNYQLQIGLLEAKNARRELRYLIVILLVGMVVLILVFLYILLHNRMRRKNLEQKTLVMERENLSRELEYKKKELATNVMYLVKKNEFIDAVSKKLKPVAEELDDQSGRRIAKIVSEMDQSNSKEGWVDFETRFQEVHVGFYNQLSKQFPGLTASDLRLCAFLRLNMTSKEIANLTYQSTDSIKVARYRLRKKLGLSRDENLVTYLTKF